MRAPSGLMLGALDLGVLTAMVRLPTGDDSRRPIARVAEGGWADISVSLRGGVLAVAVNGRTTTRRLRWRAAPRPMPICGSGRFLFDFAPGVRASRRRFEPR